MINIQYKNKISFFALWLSFSLFYTHVQSQDLEPGFLSAMPIGGNFAVASYVHSSGNILMDNTLHIEDLKADFNNMVIGYAHSFKLFNKLTKFDVIVPYAIGNFNAKVNDEDASLTLNGFGDPLFRISMILIGAKPLTPTAFLKQAPKKFKFGLVLRFKAPLGEYNPEKLINLSANRWEFKTGIAGSYTIKEKLVFEAHLNSWFFTENHDFFGGNTSKQKPLISGQVHATYIFKPGIWLALSTGYTVGGKTAINGIEQVATQNNSRYGLAFAYRIHKKHALKASFTNGIITRNGADFNTFLLAYQFMWFDKNN